LNSAVHHLGCKQTKIVRLFDLLSQWVLVDDMEAVEKRDPGGPVGAGMHAASVVPPPPPEDALDPSFFDDNGLMTMDSVSILCCVSASAQHMDLISQLGLL